MRAGLGASCSGAPKFLYSPEARGLVGARILVAEYEQAMARQTRRRSLRAMVVVSDN